MSASDLVKHWKAKAAQKAAERAALSPPVPVCFDGFVGKAHRLNMLEWASAGKLPQYLAVAMFDAVNGKSTEARKEDLTPQELIEWMRFQCVAFCSMMDEPKFTTNEVTAEDEINYAEFMSMCPEVVKEGVQWQLDGCPDIPIPTETGVMSMSDLTSFRDGGEGAATSGHGVGGQNIWWQTTPSPRHIM